MDYVRRLTIRDLLHESIEIDGVPLDARVEVEISHSKANGYQIEYFELGDIYIYTPHHDLIRLDQESFRTRNQSLFRKFENACELLALKKAASAPEERWQVCEIGTAI